MKRKEPVPSTEEPAFDASSAVKRFKSALEAPVDRHDFHPAQFTNFHIKIHAGYIFGCHAHALQVAPFFNANMGTWLETKKRDELGRITVECLEPFSQLVWFTVLELLHSRDTEAAKKYTATVELYVDSVRLCNFLGVPHQMVPPADWQSFNWKPTPYVYTLGECAAVLCALHTTVRSDDMDKYTTRVVNAFFGDMERTRGWSASTWLNHICIFEMFGYSVKVDALTHVPADCILIASEDMIDLAAWTIVVPMEALQKFNSSYRPARLAPAIGNSYQIDEIFCSIRDAFCGIIIRDYVRRKLDLDIVEFRAGIASTSPLIYSVSILLPDILRHAYRVYM